MTVKRLPPITWEEPGSEGSETPDDITINESRVSLSAENDVIPVAYGPVELPGKLAIVKADSDSPDGASLVILAVWCVGRIEEITQVYLNGEVPPEGVTMTHYLGSTGQGPDPTLQRVIPGYSDRLVYHTPDGHAVGIAYSVITIPPNTTSGFPRIRARILGRHVLTTPLTWGYSTNPAAVLVDLIADHVIGLGRPVDVDSAIALRDDCDQVMADGRRRREVSLVLNSQQSTERWVETLRTYASCTLSMEGELVKLVPLWSAAGSIQPITEEDMLRGSFQLGYRQEGKPATVVTVAYTDLTTEPVTAAEARYVPPEVTSGALPWREQRVSMPGIPSRSQAFREAIERHNVLWNAPLTATWRTFDEGLTYSVGDLVSITHPVGLTGRTFRIVAVDVAAAGRWTIKAEEYSSAVRSNVTSIDYPDKPTEIIPPPGSGDDPETSNPILQEQIEGFFLVEVYSVDNLVPPQSQIRGRWQPIAYENRAYLYGYEVQYSSDAGIWSALDQVSVEEWISDLLPTGKYYQVRVRAKGKDDAVGPWALQAIELQGRNNLIDRPTSVRSSGDGDCFSVHAQPFSITIWWTYPIGNEQIAYTEFWINTVPSAVGATLHDTYPYPQRRVTYSGLRTGEGYYVFFRFIDTNGNVGPWYHQNGTYVVASCRADKILEYISGQIEETHLHQTLIKKIDDKLGPDDPAIIAVEQEVNHLQAQYTVKIQSGNYVAGYGLAVDPTDKIRSSFLVRADRFAVGHPSEPGADKYPFVIQGGQTYIAKSTIGDAWITNAKIENLTVTNAKIGWNAVTETIPVWGVSKWINNYAGQGTICGPFYLDLWDSYAMVINTSVYFSGGFSGYNATGDVFIYIVRLFFDGQEVRYVSSSPFTKSQARLSLPLSWGYNFGAKRFGTKGIWVTAEVQGQRGASVSAPMVTVQLAKK